MKAEAIKLSSLLQTERQLCAPLFQRPYVWEKERQWIPLWDDIRSVANQVTGTAETLRSNEVKSHFLGAVVLEQLHVQSSMPDSRLIIDGQQRLTTIQIFLEAFRDILSGRQGYEGEKEQIEALIYNRFQGGNFRYKVWPTNTDQATYHTVMTCGSPAELDSALHAAGASRESHLGAAYRYFHSAIAEWLCLDDPGAEDRVRALRTTIWEKIALVVIDMDRNDDAQVIFETLNARGTPLLPSDLVKNFLFRQAVASQTEVEHLHSRYWAPFENDHEWWRAKEGKGHAERARIDTFLQHYLTLKMDLADPVPASELFLYFKKYYAAGSSDVSTHLRDFHGYGYLYKRLKEGHQDLTPNERKFFERIEILEANTLYPFLLGLYNDALPSTAAAPDRLAILGAIESFLVRRTVCRLSTRGYNRLFLDLLKTLRESTVVTHAEVAQFLLKQTAESSRWPSDDVFASSWCEIEMYRVLLRPRLRLILRALDEALQGEKTEGYTLKQGVEIEHIMPREWHEHWALPQVPDETQEDFLKRRARRDHLIHTIGNLTLLCSKLNGSVSNGKFARKRKEILRHSAINLNRAALSDVSEWSEHQIGARSRALLKVALGLWQHPGASDASPPAAP